VVHGVKFRWRRFPIKGETSFQFSSPILDSAT
jgi:hypothetical protein